MQSRPRHSNVREIRRPILATAAAVLLYACGGDDSHAPPADGSTSNDRVEQTIDGAGGDVELDNGAKVVIPEGALDGDVTIVVEEIAAATLPPSPGRSRAAGPAVAFRPHGQVFEQPVAITLPYDASQDGVLAVHRLDDEDDTSWERMAGADFEAGEATFDVMTFSVLRVVVELGATSSDAGDPTPIDASTDGGDAPATDAGTDAGDEPAMDAGTDAGEDAATDAGEDAATDAGEDASTPPGPPVGATLFIINNGQDNAGTIDRRHSVNLGLAETGTFTTGANRGAVFDYPNLIQVGDTGGIRTMCDIPERVNEANTGFDAQRDRSIGTTHITGGRGITVVENMGWYVLADHGAASIKVFAGTVAGEAEPLFELGVGATGVWDVDVDAFNDQLFATLTNGTVAVYDGFTASLADRAAPDRIFSPTTPHATHTSFRGVVFSSHWDSNGRHGHNGRHATLIVTDVGAVDAGENAAFASDGSILLFDEPGGLSGSVVPGQIIAGAATQLANPVDVHLINDFSDPVHVETLYAVDDGSDLVMAWVDVFELLASDVAPAISAATPDPQSLAGDEYVDAVGLAPDTVALLVSQNPGTGASALNPGNFRIQFATGDNFATLSAEPFDTFEGVDPVDNAAATHLLESVASHRGNAYITFSATSAASNPGGGIQIVHDMARRGGDELDAAQRDRVIAGSNTGLLDPRGIAVEWLGIFVADFGAADIKVFSKCAVGDAAPLFTVSDLGSAPSVSAVALGGDTLYAAASNGTILVYDDFATTHGQGGPTRTIVYGGVDARALAIDYGYGSLFVADVGVEQDASDGAIHRIDGIDTADGAVTPAWTNRGDMTLLGDPVGLAIDGYGGALYVAEKANGRVLRFDRAMPAVSGETNTAANGSIMVTAPQSVALLTESY
jgi:hypothetical protein